MSRRHSCLHRMTAVSALSVWGFAATTLVAQMPDNFSVVVPGTLATGGASVGAFGYDPTTDALWVAGFGSGGEIRKVFNVTGAQSFATMVTQSEWTVFIRTNLDFTGQSIPSGLLLNPLTIYEADGTTPLYPAYSQAWIIDACSPVKDPLDPDHPHSDLTRRLYRYDLQVPTGGDASTVMTSLVTLLQLGQAIGRDEPKITGNIGRQFAWSTDGQSIYFDESSVTYGGIWKVNARTGDISRIYAADTSTTIQTEPCVIHTSVRDLDPANPAEGDQILFRGSTASGNVGGLDYLIDTGTSVLGPYPLLTEAQLEETIQWNGRYLYRSARPDGSDPGVDADRTGDIRSMAVDGPDIYFFGEISRAIWRLDPQGRLAAVASMAQRVKYNEANGATDKLMQATAYRLQFFRQKTFPGFTVPQFLFQDSSMKNIGGLLAFQTGDFDRNGLVDDADLALFETIAITPIKTLHDNPITKYWEAPVDANGNDLIGDGPAYVNYLKYDLNGNGLVTAKDRFILWKFLYPGKSPCDFDLDGDVDQDDFGHLQACFCGEGHTLSDPACFDTLMDEDSDVDGADVDAFTACMTGPAVPADPNCPG